MNSFRLSGPATTQYDDDQDLFGSFMALQAAPEDLTWNDQVLFDANEVPFGAIPSPAGAQSNVYQTFTQPSDFFVQSNSGFAGPSNLVSTGASGPYLPAEQSSALRGQETQFQQLDEVQETFAAGGPGHEALSKRPRMRPKNLDWDAHRDKLKRLYMDEDRTVDEDKEIMQKDHEFDATPRQFKERFKMWQWQKKMPSEVAVWMHVKRQKRKREDGKDTTFKWRGTEWQLSKIESSAARASKQVVQNGHRQSDPRFLARHYAGPTLGMPTPFGVEYWTPQMSHQSPFGLPVPMAAVPPQETAPRMNISGSTQSDAPPRRLLLAWDGRPKSELDNVYQAARMAHQRGDRALAGKLYREALAGFKKVIGPIEEETLRVVQALASLHLEQGNDAEAHILLEDSIQQHVTRFGEDSDQTMRYTLEVANLLTGCNREDDAIAFSRSAHGVLQRTASNAEGSVTERVSLPSIAELIATAQAATRASDPHSLQFGMSVARNASRAGEPAAEALLRAIIGHCEYDPQKLAAQRLRAWADIVGLYRLRNELTRNPANHFSAPEE